MAMGSGNEHWWQQAEATTGSGGNRQQGRRALAAMDIKGNGHWQCCSCNSMMRSGEVAEEGDGGRLNDGSGGLLDDAS